MNKFFMVLIVLASASSFAVTIDKNNMIRCKPGVTPEKCERQRQNALAKKCIDEAAYDTLKAQGGMPSCYEDDATLMGWCPCGCFSAETQIKVNSENLDQEETAQRVVDLFGAGNRPQVAHLSADSSVSKGVKLKTSGVRNASVGPEELPLVVVDTDSQGSKGHIELSSFHPVLLADGSILRAERLRPGHKLLNYLGKPETIKTVTRKNYAGLVYNFNVDSSVDSEHVVIANGLLMGDLYLQGSLTYFENQILVRQ